MRIRKYLLIVTLVVLFLSMGGYQRGALELKALDPVSMIVTSYSPSGPVHISDNNFTGWPGTGSPGDPFVISGLNITSGGVSSCLSIFNSSSYVEVRDCYIEYTGTSYAAALMLIYANNSLVIDCVIKTHWYSIEVFGCHNSNITGNVVEGTLYTTQSPGVRFTDNSMTSQGENATMGIRLAGDCDLGVVENNTIDLEGLEGIGVKGMEIFKCDNVTVNDNFVKNIDRTGILVSVCPNSIVLGNTVWKSTLSSGIVVELSDFTRVEDNLVYDCEAGILLNSNNCTVVGNSAFRNSQNGIIASMFNCTIYDNFIGFNTGDLGQGFETQAANYWDDGVSVGNYWSDYDNVSEIYTVGTGLAWNGVDHFPMVFVESTMNNIAAIELEFDFPGHNLIWTSIGTLPQSYELALDGEFIEEDAWSGSTITTSLDGLTVGEHVLTLTTHFGSRMDASGEVLVEVLASQGPSIIVETVVSEHNIPTVVSATVTDISEVVEVILSYSVNTSVWTNVTMTLSGGLWTAQIPALSGGTEFSIMVFARDSLNNWAVRGYDNLVVTVEHPPPDTTTLFIVVGVGVAAVVILGSVMMKRR